MASPVMSMGGRETATSMRMEMIESDSFIKEVDICQLGYHIFFDFLGQQVILKICQLCVMEGTTIFMLLFNFRINKDFILLQVHILSIYLLSIKLYKIIEIQYLNPDATFPRNCTDF